MNNMNVMFPAAQMVGFQVGPSDGSGSTRERLAKTKASFTTRRVPRREMQTILVDRKPPNPGDLVLARVLKIGHHKRLQLAQGRFSSLFPGDEIILCAGNRYAPDQFEALVPKHLGQCHLAAAGGIAARVVAQHDRINQPTSIELLGFVGNAAHRRLNLRQFALSEAPNGRRATTIAVAGTSMNSGKTTVAANLIRGLTRAGHKVGAAKITGTGAFGDYLAYQDAGARWVLDFTDAGYASTYLLDPSTIDRILRVLRSNLLNLGATAIVLEIADGQYQRETSTLFDSHDFRSAIDGLFFAALDAAGAVNGVRWIRDGNLPLLAVSGCLTASRLATIETERAANIPVVATCELSDPDVVEHLMPIDKRCAG